MDVDPVQSLRNSLLPGALGILFSHSSSVPVRCKMMVSRPQRWEYVVPYDPHLNIVLEEVLVELETRSWLSDASFRRGI